MFWAVKSPDSFTYKAASSLLSISVSQSFVELMFVKPLPCVRHSARSYRAFGEQKSSSNFAPGTCGDR